ncbi:hypothetical protein L1987_15154 [Smallanthus sonchifolius]|uniref:Uncharacterized protein n=1 Tax=Smallanthus sonchifolius TaxID=185202 RepID=A0ACB9J6U2_9ASTR|nr:hypothetical protein L1987_15154 [Smallanthus sonchifolius]
MRLSHRCFPLPERRVPDSPPPATVIHHELPNDPETFVHRSGRTGRAGKEGTAILMFTNSQKRRTIRSLERDVGCKFDFINPPAVEDVLESSAQQVVATLSGVHQESVEFFTPTAQKLIEEQGARMDYIATDSGSCFIKSARTVTGFLADVYKTAADEPGKIHIIADERVQGALPAFEDDGPAGDSFRRSGRSGGSSSSRGGSRSVGGSDWLIGERRSSRSPSFGTRGSGSSSRIRDRNFDGACFHCGRSGRTGHQNALRSKTTSLPLVPI